jgi:hypothetical protein
MDAQPKGGTPATANTDQRTSIDPLRRVFVPIERRMSDGNFRFRTQDKQRYVRLANGQIRRMARG